MGPSGHWYSYWVILDCLEHVCILVELPVQRRLCSIFVNWVTRHSRVFRGLTGSQRTSGIWGVTDIIGIFSFREEFVLRGTVIST